MMMMMMNDEDEDDDDDDDDGDNDDDDDDDDDGRSVTRYMRSSALRTPSTSTRLSTWRSVRISTTNNVVPRPGNFSPSNIYLLIKKSEPLYEFKAVEIGSVLK